MSLKCILKAATLLNSLVKNSTTIFVSYFFPHSDKPIYYSSDVLLERWLETTFGHGGHSSKSWQTCRQPLRRRQTLFLYVQFSLQSSTLPLGIRKVTWNDTATSDKDISSLKFEQICMFQLLLFWSLKVKFSPSITHKKNYCIRPKDNG